MPHHKKDTQGFSLIEMSIVLVIIGLLVGGIIVGDSMIKSASLKNVLAEKEQYVAAINQFKEKYNGLPGDLYNATSFWPEDTTGTDKVGDSTGNEVENGNGDGKIAAVISTDGYEAHRAWRQMALAGFIDGNYNGQYAGSFLEPGLHVPASDYKEKVLGWNVYFVGPKNSDSVFFDGQYQHIFYMGLAPYTYSAINKGGMHGEDIFALDEKFDDGMPATGKLRSGKNSGIFGGSCISSNAATATYVASDKRCIPIFLTDIP